MLCDFVVAPFAEFDLLICTSRAVADMVRAVTGAFGDYLTDRLGGGSYRLPRLEVIPLGVNSDRFRPATADERAREWRSYVASAYGCREVIFSGEDKNIRWLNGFEFEVSGLA